LVLRAPQRFDGWASLADALVQLGEGKSAEEISRQAIERFPDRAEAHVLLAEALRTEGRYDEALAALDAAGAEQEIRSRVAPERAPRLGLAGRSAPGAAEARGALAGHPEAAELRAARGSLLSAAGAAGEGPEATDRALALAGDEPRPLRVRCEFR